MTWYSSKRPGRWGMTYSAKRGTAFVVFGDGHIAKLYHQRSPATALLRAWRLRKHERRYV
jgi:hypothetical protein